MNTGRNVIIAAIVITVGMLLGGVWLISGRQTPPSPENLVPEGSWVTGAKNGNVTLVEFGDFQCPSCQTYDTVLRQILTEFPANLRVVWRHYPLGGHKNARQAAYAAEAAGVGGKFWEMHDKLFATQTEWSESDQAEEVFAGYAQELGLGREKFITDMASNAVGEKIQKDLQQGNDLEVTGTPTFFVNGERISNPGSGDDFRQIIKAAAARAGTPAGAEAVTGQARFKVILLGKEVDFSQAKYQSSPSAQLHPDIQLTDGDGQTLKLVKPGATLEEFFKALKISFSDLCFELDTGEKYCNSGQTTMKMYVNGQASGQYQKYVPVNGDKILLTYGRETVAEVEKQIESLAE